MEDIKYYIGPMTQNVIDSCIEYSIENPYKIGFIATRRQIDYNGGYVGYTTRSFSDYVLSSFGNTVICRDHSGPKQGSNENSPAYNDIKSLIEDAHSGFDIIHIDPWKKFSDYNIGLRETINNIFILDNLGYEVQFEVGTEEAIRPFSVYELDKFLGDLQFELGDLFKKITYAVIQSGTSLLGTKNTGKFDLERLKKMINICEKYGVLSKEHNGDYLSDEEIKIRFENGLNAINIAPEFGVLETKVLLEHIKDEEIFENVFNICLNSGKWQKWVNPDFNPLKNKRELIEICGHYVNKDIKKLVKIKNKKIKKRIKERLEHLMKLI